jgi:hypothetical protein
LSGEFKPGGTSGSAAGAPAPISMTVPALTGTMLVPSLAPALSVQPAAIQSAPAVVAAPAAQVQFVPALPKSIIAYVPTAVKRVPPVKPAAKPGAAGAPNADADEGRRLFDQGAPKPEGFDNIPGKVIDPGLLAEDIHSPAIMRAARAAGLVFELTPATLSKMKPGVGHNFVIVRNPGGTIEMTVGRLTAANVSETGVKHIALADGRAVIFSGVARMDEKTGRPSFDFNSGMYSSIGRDPRWEPTPENARALAAHAEAILKTPVDVVDHFKNRTVEVPRAVFESPRRVVRRGVSRGDGWEVDGRPAARLSGGSFKDVLIHPEDPALVLKLFSEIGAKDTAGSLSEKRRELRNLQPLLAIGRAPGVVEQGALALETSSTKGTMITGYIVQKRVFGRELGEIMRDPDPKVRALALAETRALFEDLIAARVKLEDKVRMGENVSIGVAGRGGPVKAWVLDAGEATRVAPRGAMDKLLGRPDPLRAHYERILARLAQLL